MRILPPSDPRTPLWRWALGTVLLVVAALLLAEVTGGVLSTPTRELVDF